MADFPADLRYTEDHEWLRKLGNERVQVGITAFAADQLGDVVTVELPTEGDEVTKGEVFGSVESVKSVSDLFAPVTGKVMRINTPLGDSPEYVNEDPYGEGWMIELELADASEADALMDAQAYGRFVADES